MSESNSHKNAKRKASGQTEVPISKNRRLDSASQNRATEVELSGNFEQAVSRLKDSGRNQKVLQTRHNEMKKAVDEMKRQGVGGSVKNMGGTKRISVSKPKGKR